MLLSSIAEVFSIGALLPFLGILTAPERLFEHPAAQPFIQSLELHKPSQLLFPLTLTFCLAAVTAGAMRLILLWAITRLSFATGADLSISIYRRTLYQPYAVHCARNSSTIINGISGKVNTVINNIIMPAIILISSGVMLITILFALLTVEPVIALAAFSTFGIVYALVISLTRRQLLSDSKRIAQESTNVIKSLQEGLGGIRDVLINGSQASYCQIYRNADLPLRHAQGNSSFISNSPRHVVEALGMVLIALLAFWLAQQPNGMVKAIPVVGALALGAMRLLPVFQNGYGAITGIRSGQVSLQDTLELLDQPLPDYVDHSTPPAIEYKRSISLERVSFRYSHQAPYVLSEISLKIDKGSRVGFIGSTGSGKSTLLDIVMGLLPATSGALVIDETEVVPDNNRAWQAHIAHVPQAIFLADTTIEENIAFGVEKNQIDRKRVQQAAQQAQISEIIESWPEQYQTFVGERGIRLSGGQRQRIGIARALYRQANVIIFDEATSALDTETEQAVMQAIDGLSKDLTLLIIAHRLTTLRKCTQIVELGEGRIERVGSFEDVVNETVNESNNN